jgi:hypothetical protein
MTTDDFRVRCAALIDRMLTQGFVPHCLRHDRQRRAGHKRLVGDGHRHNPTGSEGRPGAWPPCPLPPPRPPPVRRPPGARGVRRARAVGGRRAAALALRPAPPHQDRLHGTVHRNVLVLVRANADEMTVGGERAPSGRRVVKATGRAKTRPQYLGGGNVWMSGSQSHAGVECDGAVPVGRTQRSSRPSRHTASLAGAGRPQRGRGFALDDGPRHITGVARAVIDALRLQAANSLDDGHKANR